MKRVRRTRTHGLAAHCARLVSRAAYGAAFGIAAGRIVSDSDPYAFPFEGDGPSVRCLSGALGRRGHPQSCTTRTRTGN